MSILAALPEAAAVAIVRLRSLGDCVLTTPAIHLLKSARPDLRIAVVAEERFHPVFADNPDIEAILAPLAVAIRHFRPYLCLNLHGGSRSAWLTAASGARLRAGFGHFRHSWIYNVRIPRAQQIFGDERIVHTAEHVASAMFYLGVPHLAIPRARLFTRARPSQQRYAVIHPFAATPAKTWPAGRFAEAAVGLKSELDVKPVFTGTADDDFGPFRQFETLVQPLEATKGLIAGATLFIGNDSGPAHIAAAFGIPSVVLFGPSDPRIWSPWRVEAAVLQSDPIESISVRQVTQAAARLRPLNPAVVR